MLGYRVPFDLLASVTGRDESDLIWPARPRRAGCVRGDREDEFAFRHALVREAIGERLLGRERRRLHEAAHTPCSAPATPTGPWWPSTPAAPAGTTTC